jgi:restriction system protein
MAEITWRRNGEFVRHIFKLLLNKPDGVPAKEILATIPQAFALTEFEAGVYPSAPNSPRVEKIIRFATIPLVKAGWMVKTKGRWFVTEEGQAAYSRFSDPDVFYREAIRLYHEWKKSRPQEIALEEEAEPEEPAAAITVEEIEELAQQQIQALLETIKPYDFQTLVAELLKAMGYFIYWVAPPGPDRGMDIIAYHDPLGATGPRVKVQVKHRLGQAIPAGELRSFMAVVGADEIGLFVSSGGFTADAKEEARTQEKRKITLIDLESLIERWIEYYTKLSEEARQLLPLKAVYFPATPE